MSKVEAPTGAVLVIARGERVVLRGMVAVLVGYLAGDPVLAADVERADNGKLHFTWSPGSIRVWVEKYYPAQKSSNLTDESS